MDEDRRIRFLVPPMLFLASLLWGATADQTSRYFIAQALLNPDWSKLIGIIAGGGVMVFAAGYVFGTIGYFILRLFFHVKSKIWGGSQFHEATLSEDVFANIWRYVGASGVPDRSQELYVGVAFDHDFLRKNHEGIHRWVVRRWNAFSIATSSLCAVILSVPCGYIIGIPFALAWYLPVGVFAGMLGAVMVWARRDTMNMLDFMGRLPHGEAAMTPTEDDPVRLRSRGRL